MDTFKKIGISLIGFVLGLLIAVLLMGGPELLMEVGNAHNN